MGSAMTFKRSAKSADRAHAFMDANDLDYYLGEHDISGPPPGAAHVTSYLGVEKLRKIALKMRRQRDGWNVPVRLVG